MFSSQQRASFRTRRETDYTHIADVLLQGGSGGTALWNTENPSSLIDRGRTCDIQKKQVDFSAHVRTLEEKTGTYVQRDVIYIGFIYTFYLQIFISKSSLYTFIF